MSIVCVGRMLQQSVDKLSRSPKPDEGRVLLEPFSDIPKAPFRHRSSASSSELALQALSERRLRKKAGDGTRTRDSLLGRHCVVQLTRPLQLHNRKRHCDHPLGRPFEKSYRSLVRTNLQTCPSRLDLDILTSIGCNGSRCWIRAQPVVSIVGHDTGKPALHLSSAVGDGNHARRSVSQPKQRGERQV